MEHRIRKKIKAENGLGTTRKGSWPVKSRTKGSNSSHTLAAASLNQLYSFLFNELVNWTDGPTTIALLQLSKSVNHSITLSNIIRQHVTRLGLNEMLLLAVLAERQDIVALVLDRGANVHYDSDIALQDAAGVGNTMLCDLLISRGASVKARDDRALRAAARAGNTATVALLLLHGANIHAGSDRALLLACLENHLETVNVLLNHGACVNGHLPQEDERSVRSNTNGTDIPLICAAARGHVLIVKMLLNRGATAICEALSKAAEEEHLEVAKLLMNKWEELGQYRVRHDSTDVE
ncbi:hypothetical protein PhCBS80983_g02198 [Powellomyces hirtus]|uniref:Uncharacterized protein n=1 Tax=Powellomyces hirtus TaxID=109895 RepID=A0A507E9T5_9FUNG|nr:hypothetical protein PhCBS80983_g02198 [Powellomyces hirtus]